MSIIDVKNLTFRYNKNTKNILENLNFSCDEGEIIMLLGLNGSGKSTLIKLLVGLLDKYEGDIIIDQKNIKEMSILKRSKIISYVPQNVIPSYDYTVSEYLLFGMNNQMKTYETPKKHHYDKVSEYLDKFNITHLKDRRLRELSGGERQIVNICEALIQDTKIIVLDEPTSALDIKNQNEVLSILKMIVKKENKTFILSSHSPNHGLFLNSKVCLLKNGNIVTQGNATDIITIDILRNIYGDNICYSKDLDYNEISFK